MSIFRRLSTTLFSRIDQVVGEIENHDALIQASIGAQRNKLATAKVRLSRIQSQEERIARQIEGLHEGRRRWAQRAVQAAKEDEQRALACMQRRHQCQDAIKPLEKSLVQYRDSRMRMMADIHHCEEMIRNMGQKHALLRARQASAEAVNAVNEIGVSELDQLENSFERWEVRIAQEELAAPALGPLYADDGLEQDYRRREDDAQLREELAQLMNKGQ